MKIPNEIRFMSHTYEVIQEAGYRNSHENYTGYQGTTNYRINKIKLDSELPNRDEVFLHELTHIILHHLGIDMSEKDIERFGEGLHHIMKENDLIKEE